MRDVWRWWKVRKSQIRALLVLGLILLWMSLNLWQTQRQLSDGRASHEQIIRQQETTRQRQLDKLMEVMETHHAQQDLDAAALRDDLCELRLMIGQLIEQTGKHAVR